MKTTIDTLADRLEALMGDVNFRSDYDRVLDSPEQLLAFGEHNLQEYEKVEAMDEDRQERIWNLMSTVLASGLQQEAIEKYGNIDDSSIRLVLHGGFSHPEDKAYWDKLRQTTERGLLGFGLTNKQCQAVMKHIYDKLPEAIMEYLEALYSPSRFLPRLEAQPITTALADMMKEVAP